MPVVVDGILIVVARALARAASPAPLFRFLAPALVALLLYPRRGRRGSHR
jgi:hypothetical protein